ncbi:hypothetical protein ACP6PL_12870 [Dapis sp. BLCC M126]
MHVTSRFQERLVEEGYNPSYGARPPAVLKFADQKLPFRRLV